MKHFYLLIKQTLHCMLYWLFIATLLHAKTEDSREDQVISVNPEATCFVSNKDEGNSPESFCIDFEIKNPEAMMEIEDIDEINEVFFSTSIAQDSPIKKQTTTAAKPVAKSNRASQGTSEDIATSQLLCTAASSNLYDLTSHYKKADELSAQSQKAWNARQIAQQDFEKKSKASKQAEEILTQAKIDRDSIELRKTRLGRIAHFANQGVGLTSLTSSVPVLALLPGAFQTTATAADLANKYWVNKDVRVAKNNFKTAQYDEQMARQLLEELKSKAPLLDRAAQEEEIAARAVAAEAIALAANNLKPPIESFNSNDWHQWAERVVTAAEWPRERIERLSHHGRKDPASANKEIATAWSQRVRLADQNTRHTKEQQKAELELHQRALTEVEQALRKAEQEATFAQSQLALARTHQAEVNLQFENYWEELNKLEKEKPRHGLDNEITQKKNELSRIPGELEQSSRDVKNCEAASSEASAIVDREEARALPLRKALKEAQVRLQLNHERAQTDAETARLVFQKIWPEDALQATSPRTTSSSNPVTPTTHSKNIAPPLLLDIVTEQMGRDLLRQQKEGKNVLKNNATVNVNKQPLATTLIIPEINQPTAEDEARWSAREKVDQLYAEAAAVIAGFHDETATVQTQSTLSSRINKQLGAKISKITKKTESLASATSTAFSAILGDPSNNIANKKKKKSLEDQLAAAQRNREILAPAITAENEWKIAARQAESARVARGGIPRDEAIALEAWRKADQEALHVRIERQRAQEEEQQALQFQQTWNANVARWAARAEADRLEVALKQALDRLEKLEAEVGVQAKASDLYQTAFTEMQKIKALAIEASREWLKMAYEEESLIALSGQDENLLAKAKLNLRDADRAVNALKERVMNQFQEDKSIKAFGTTKSSNVFSTEKIRNLQELFKPSDDALATAKERYMRNASPEAKAIYKKLYDQADQLEKAALKKYDTEMTAYALSDARAKTPGAEGSWNLLVEQASKNVKDAERQRRDTGMSDPWADNIQRAIERASSIATVHKKALVTYQKEASRLAAIEARWTQELEAEVTAIQMKAVNAAKQYAEGNSTAWDALTEVERMTYNNDVQAANRIRTKTIQQAIVQEKEDAQVAADKVKLLNESSRAGKRDQQEALKEAETKAADLIISENIEQERQKALVAAQLITLGKKAEALVNKARSLEDSATTSWNQAMSASRAEKSRLLSDVNDKVQQVESSWNQALEIYQQGERLAPQELKETWKENLKKTEHSKIPWSAKVLFCRASQAAASGTIKEALEAILSEETFSSQYARHVKTLAEAWSKTVQAYQALGDDCSKEDLSRARGNQAIWQAHILGGSALQVATSADAFLSSNEEYLLRSHQAAVAWNQAVTAYEKVLKLLPQPTLPWVFAQFEDTEYQQIQRYLNHTKNQENKWRSKIHAFEENKKKVEADRAVRIAEAKRVEHEAEAAAREQARIKEVARITAEEKAKQEQLALQERERQRVAATATAREQAKIEKAEQMADALRDQAMAAEAVAMSAQAKATAASLEKSVPLWDEAIEKANNVAAAWSKAEEAYQELLTMIPKSEIPWVLTLFQDAKYQKVKRSLDESQAKSWKWRSSCSDWKEKQEQVKNTPAAREQAKIEKAEQMADVLRDQARAAEAVAMSAQAKATAACLEQSVPLWGEAIEKANNVAAAWSKAVEAYQELLTTISNPVIPAWMAIFKDAETDSDYQRIQRTLEQTERRAKSWHSNVHLTEKKKVEFFIEQGRLAEKKTRQLQENSNHSSMDWAFSVGASLSFKNVAKALDKALEAEQRGKQVLAQKYRKVAALYECSAEFYTKNFKNIVYDAQFSPFYAGQYFSSAADKLYSGIYAEQDGRLADAKKYHEIAVLEERAAEYFAKAANNAGISNANCWQSYKAGEAFLGVSSNIKKAIDEEEKGSLAVAQKYRKVAVLHERAGECFAKRVNTNDDSGYFPALLFEKAVLNLEKLITAEAEGRPNAIIIALRLEAEEAEKQAIRRAEGSF